MGEPLLQRVAAGELEAVEACIQRYGDLVWSLALKYCGDRHEAEEAVNEVFSELWANARRHEPHIAAEPTFVTMVARRRLIRRTGKSERRRSAARGSASRQPLEHLPLAEQVEVSKAIDILDGMKPEQRQVVELSLCEGYSHSDITNHLHLAPGAVKAHLKKGLLAVGGAQPI